MEKLTRYNIPDCNDLWCASDDVEKLESQLSATNEQIKQLEQRAKVAELAVDIFTDWEHRHLCPKGGNKVLECLNGDCSICRKAYALSEAQNQLKQEGK